MSYVSFYCCRMQLGLEVLFGSVGACCFFLMFLIPVLRSSQRINHLYNEFSRHLSILVYEILRFFKKSISSAVVL